MTDCPLALSKMDWKAEARPGNRKEEVQGRKRAKAGVERTRPQVELIG